MGYNLHQSMFCLHQIYAMWIYVLAAQFVYLIALLGASSMEVKTEADSNDISECSHDDKPTIGMFGYLLQFDIFCSFGCYTLTHCYIDLSSVSIW